jgi:hypothetical protein
MAGCLCGSVSERYSFDAEFVAGTKVKLTELSTSGSGLNCSLKGLVPR